jgi:hypothetical protein
MDLGSWLSKYPGIRVASLKDNEKLLAFYDHQPMSAAKLGVQFRRGPDFFGMMAARADKNLVLVHENSAGCVQGVATLSFRDGFVGGSKKTVGYLGDLRVGHDRSLVRMWKKTYSDLIAESSQFSETNHATDYLTAVIDDNALARTALMQDKRGLIQYSRVARYQMVNIFRRFAFSSPHKSSLFHVSTLSKEDLPELCEFFDRENQSVDFGFTGSEILRRLSSWPSLALENGILVRNLRGEICGFTWLWNTRDVKKTIFNTSSLALKAAGVLTPGLPRSGQAIGFLHMTALTVASQATAREEIKSLLVDKAYEIFRSSVVDGRKCNFLALCEFDFDSFKTALRPYICFRTPMALYSVNARSQNAPVYSSKIGFEMAIV